MSPDPDALVGCLLGQAVGDMVGLPMEDLSPRRAARLFPDLSRPRFVFGHGAGSDDTEHACLTLEAVGGPDRSADEFARRLGRRLRWWLAAGPPGVGKATALACLKLWLGWPPANSGVFSAGNGPAMRATVLGVRFPDPERRQAFVRASTRLTHTDPKAEHGAFVVAELARRSADSRGGPPPTAADLAGIADRVPDAELRGLLGNAADRLAAGPTVAEFAASRGLGRGVTGYMYHTVPVAAFAFLRHPDDFRSAVEGAVRCGGDTDTVAAVAGGLVGARVGKGGIPAEWLGRHRDWPWSVGRMEALARGTRQGDWPPLRAAMTLPRNLAFFAVVCGHLARRGLPPY